MTRLQVLLVALAALLIIVLFFFLVWQPGQEERENLDNQIQAAITRQEQLTAERDRLREVRAAAPEIEAQVASVERIVPGTADVPSLLRQLQTAADDAGVVLRVVNPDRPEAVDGEAEGLASLSVSVQVEGSYFQLVDFVRRTEDPEIVARGIRWRTVAMSELEYPQLQAVISGHSFALLPAAPVEEEPPTADDESGEETDTADSDDELVELEDAG
jgi:Tfp pilus assembly protein PilO